MVAALAATSEIDELAAEVREAHGHVKKAEAEEARAIGGAAQRRIHLGNLLIRARKQWPERGPNAKGWGEFLAKVEIEMSTAWRYMQLAGYVAVSCVTNETPTYRDAGIDSNASRGRATVANDDAPTFDVRIAGRVTRWEDDRLSLKMIAQCTQKALDLNRAGEKEQAINVVRATEMNISALEEVRLIAKMAGDILAAHHVGHVVDTQLGGSGKRNGVANRQGGQRRYNERAASGKCVKCDEPALPGHARCETHRHKMLTQKQREKAER